MVYPCVRIGEAHPVGAPRAGFVQCMQSIAVPAANRQRTGQSDAWHARGARHRRSLRMGADLIRAVVHVLDKLDLRYLVPAARQEHSMHAHPPTPKHRPHRPHCADPLRLFEKAEAPPYRNDSRKGLPYPSRKSRCNTRKRRPPTASTRDCPSGSCTARQQWAVVRLHGLSHGGCGSQSGHAAAVAELGS